MPRPIKQDNPERAHFAQEIRESALLLYCREETAQRLGLTETQLAALLEDPYFNEAWTKGQAAVQRGLHNALMTAALKDKSIGAIRLALQRLHHLKVVAKVSPIASKQVVSDIVNDRLRQIIQANNATRMSNHEDRNAAN